MANNDSPNRRHTFQFRLATLLLIMFLVSVLAASLGGMLRPTSGSLQIPQMFFVYMAIAAPVGVLIFLSCLRALRDWVNRRTGQEQNHEDSEQTKSSPFD